MIFFNSGVLEKALPFFKKSISLNTKNKTAHYYLGQIYYRNGQNTDAKQSFLNAIKIDSTNYSSHYFLGLVLRQIGDSEWAIKEFEIAQKDEDLKVKCLLAKGTCYKEKENASKSNNGI